MTGRTRTAVVAVMLVVASSCGGGPVDAEAEAVVDSAPVSTVAESVDEAVARSVAADGDLDMEDVVAAALLIASGGDLEAAISAGLVGEAEADAALDALERGSLDRILVD